MPHPIDFQDVENKLFLLIQLGHSSKAYIESSGIKRREQDSDSLTLDRIEYAGSLALIVGDYAVECAAKTRVAGDFIKRYDDEDKLNRISQEAAAVVECARFKSGKPISSIRESCNKIIHATEAKLNWAKFGNGENEYEYWNGIYCLNGEHRGREWNLDLNICDWGGAMRFYHRQLQRRVDWSEIWENVFD